MREAITLERLEYCILLDENGNKRYIQGPAVVFPQPTETFVAMRGARKFRAIELNENTGLYIKVIAPYEENGVRYKVGDELFITGKDTMIYLPRPEHAIIKYGDQERHYAVAIPAGEARYVLDRNKGTITLKRGPAIYLPDPRIELIIRRVLDPKTVSLWFPGNREAYDYNRRLAQQNAPQIAAEFAAVASVPVQAARASAAPKAAPAPGGPAAPPPPPSSEFAGDDFTRSQTFTGPRTIVLDTRYDGAVAIDVWTGYAVLVVSKTGERKVVTGPHTHLLEYDETLQVLELSTGTPKTEHNLFKTVYLRVLNNKVSDQVEVETRDLVRVQLQLSYRVNFEGDPNRWFEVENYVKFLTDHLRSLVRAAVKRHGIEQFYADSVAILRDVILGVAGEDGKRPGRRFEENGMRVYDVRGARGDDRRRGDRRAAGPGAARRGPADAVAGRGAAPARHGAPGRGGHAAGRGGQVGDAAAGDRAAHPRGRAAAALSAGRAGGQARPARAPAAGAAGRAGAARGDPRGRARPAPGDRDARADGPAAAARPAPARAAGRGRGGGREGAGGLARPDRRAAGVRRSGAGGEDGGVDGPAGDPGRRERGRGARTAAARLAAGAPAAGRGERAGEVVSARPRRRAPCVGCGDRGSGVAVPRPPGHGRRETSSPRRAAGSRPREHRCSPRVRLSP
ncbi:hypothetical protein [Nannocystis pusilla]|uniref:hypothetical protein n=1 Tax=Nannocystis pusilla TaxID=889268 RepID=UPI003DA265B8